MAYPKWLSELFNYLKIMNPSVDPKESIFNLTTLEQMYDVETEKNVQVRTPLSKIFTNPSDFDEEYDDKGVNNWDLLETAIQNQEIFFDENNLLTFDKSTGKFGLTPKKIENSISQEEFDAKQKAFFDKEQEAIKIEEDELSERFPPAKPEPEKAANDINVNVDPYMIMFENLVRDLHKKDSRFSNDSSEYLQARGSIETVLKEMQDLKKEGNLSAEKLQEGLQNISNVIKPYQTTHNPQNRKLSSRQKSRMEIFERFDNLAAELKPYAKAKEELEPGDIIAADAQLRELQMKMVDNEEFLNTPHIPEDLKTGGSLEQLQELKTQLTGNKKVSKEEMKYLDGRIASTQFFEKLAENPAKGNLREPKETDTLIIMDNIHQDEYQRTSNGCYSCSYKLLLQSRGLDLTQKQIRAFRDEKRENDVTRILKDKPGNVANMGGLAIKSIKNTGICEKTYMDLGKESKEVKEQLKQDIKDTVINALKKHKSPVSLLIEGHYRTVVGYDKEKDEFLVKNSLNILGTGGNPNEIKREKFSTLLNSKKLSLTFLVDINPENPTDSIDQLEEKDKKLLEFTNGKYFFNEKMSIGGFKENNKEDLTFVKSTISNIKTKSSMPPQIIYYLPTKLYAQKDLAVANDSIEGLNNSPKKEAFKEKLAEMKKALNFPDDTLVKISASKQDQQDIKDFLSSRKITTKKDFAEKLNKINLSSGKDKSISMEDFVKYHYFNLIEKHMDKITPKQMDYLLDEDFMNKKIPDLMGNTDLLRGVANNIGYETSLNYLSEYSRAMDEYTAPETVAKAVERFNRIKGDKKFDELSEGDKFILTWTKKRMVDLNKKLPEEERINTDDPLFEIKSNKEILSENLAFTDDKFDDKLASADKSVKNFDISSEWYNDNVSLGQNAKAMQSFFKNNAKENDFGINKVLFEKAAYSAEQLANIANNISEKPSNQAEFAKGLLCMQLINGILNERQSSINKENPNSVPIKEALSCKNQGPIEKKLSGANTLSFLDNFSKTENITKLSSDLQANPQSIQQLVKNQRYVMNTLNKNLDLSVKNKGKAKETSYDRLLKNSESQKEAIANPK